MTLGVTEQLNRLQINDPKVFSISNSPADASPSVLSDLAKILECLTVEFFSRQNQVFHYLHQRSAPITQIQVKHGELHAELERLNIQIRDVWKKARDVYAFIPKLANPQEKAKALSLMMGVEMTAFHVHKNTVELCNLLKDTSRNDALEYYKTVVRDCEALVNCSTMDEKISGLQKIFAAVDVKIAQNSAPAVSEVYDTILLFIRYTVLCFKREAAENAPILKELQTLDTFIQKKFVTAPVDLDVTEEVAENPDSLVNKYLAAASDVELPRENRFRNGNWTTWLTTFPFARYAPIRNHKDSLEAIAQALYKLECLLLDRIKTVSTDELEKDIEICQGLEQLIGKQLKSLAGVPIAKEIHAGWYYVTALQTQAKVLQTSIQLFNQMATATYATELGVIDRLVKALPASSQGATVTQVMCLWQLTQDVASLPVQHIELAKVIDQMLAHLGAETTAFTEQELQVPNKVFTKEFMWGDSMSEVVQSYLLKGFLQYLYFTKGDQRALDPRFDAVFFMLKCDQNYKEGFDAWLKNCQMLKQMQNAYVPLSDMNSNVFLSKAMSTVASTLLARPLSSFDDVKNRLERANAVADKLDVKNSPNEQIRFTWIKRLIRDFEAEFKNYIV